METSGLFSLKEKFVWNLMSLTGKLCLLLKLCVVVSDGRRAESPPAAHQNDKTEFTKLKFKNPRAPKPHSVLTRQAIIPRSHQVSWDKSSQAAANTELALASWNPESLQSFSFRLFALVSFLSPFSPLLSLFLLSARMCVSLLITFLSNILI